MNDSYFDLQSFPNSFDNNVNAESFSFYRCKKCNTLFQCQKENTVKECVFCHHDSFVEEDGKTLEESYIIPFVKSEKDAIENYKKAVFWNPFVPFSFKKKSIVSKIKRVYLPCYFLDVHVDGNISFYAGDKSSVKKDGKKVEETKRYEVLFRTNFDYDPFFISTYSKIPEELFELVCEEKNPNLQEYQKSLLEDSYVIQSDIDNEQVTKLLREKIQNHCLHTIKKGINHQLKKVQQNGLNIHSNDIKKVLCPVYLLTVSYQGKNYYYLMNGENGRDYAQICFGKIEIFLFSLILAVFIFILSYFIVMYV